MNTKTSIALFEWSAGLLIGVIPLLCHSLVTFAGGSNTEASDAWTVDLLFVAITTSGLCAISLFTRLAKGAITTDHLKPHSMFLMALNMVAFLLSGVLFGQVSSGVMHGKGLALPIVFLVLATASSLYFEILIALEVSKQETY